MKQIHPGVWKLTLGTPEKLTPVGQRHVEPAAGRLAKLPAAKDCPLPLDTIRGRRTSRGYLVSIPLADKEQIYGLGLQLLSFNQRGRKKTLRVNSDPRADLGDSHAPVPFYVTTAGYGILVDTSRYLTIYAGSATRRESAPLPAVPPLPSPTAATPAAADAAPLPENLYATPKPPDTAQVIIEIPVAEGVDIYVFAGRSLREAVQRYNLFSGGGCLPPRWGLGVWYRCRGDFTAGQATALAQALRNDRVPCDVFGLEPGWQTHAYPCTFVWGDRFPNPRQFLRAMADLRCRVNLWTHAFVDPASPIYRKMLRYAGDFQVWKGLVPDLTIPAARKLMSDFYERKHVNLGASGYKLDECDNSDYIFPPWSYPEISRFPSGHDGEQMHSMMGMSYQETVHSIFRKRDQRTYGQVRSAHALAAPYPYALYSDLYDHRDFIRGVANAGFSGLLWSPEVRHADSEADLIRRLQSVALSPQALINAWYIKHPPWKQWRTEDNNADRWLPNSEALTAACRAILQLRMQLIPYLHAAFFRYYEEGLPPFRPLVMDYPGDANTWNVDNQWMAGDRLLVAPLTADMKNREIYLPVGQWCDYWTGAALDGRRTIRAAPPLSQIPLFVKYGSLLPLAQPTNHTDDPASLQLTLRIYGHGNLPVTLVEEDSKTFAFEQGLFNRVTIEWTQKFRIGRTKRVGNAPCPRYSVIGIQVMRPTA